MISLMSSFSENSSNCTLRIFFFIHKIIYLQRGKRKVKCEKRSQDSNPSKSKIRSRGDSLLLLALLFFLLLLGFYGA
jgi:hypothetical protein